jgi:NDP-sugar pyrophosphorylase family protein
MTTADIKEKASEIRAEKASALKSFFSNCFVPPEPSTTVRGSYIENDTHIENNTYIDNKTLIENDTYIDNDIYIENNTPKNDMRLENNTLESNTRLENDILKNKTHVDNKTLKNTTYSGRTALENTTHIENATHNSNTVKLASRLGFTAIGVLAVLIDEFPSGFGMLNVTQMSKACGVVRTTLIAQLRVLEKHGVIRLGEPEKQGRRLRIMCIQNATHRENDTPACSSSSFKENNYYNDAQRYDLNKEASSNNIYVDNTTHVENDIYVERDTRIENNTIVGRISNSKITKQVAARELYFTAKASHVNISKLSNQCFRQFLAIKQEKGQKYAIALFLNLLTKSRDNPNAYVIKAIQQGATASPDDENRADIISRAGDTMFKRVGEDILQRELDAAFSMLSMTGASQNQVMEELEWFTNKIIMD